jgi:hypothetical protein
MRKAMRVLGFGLFVMAGLLTACGPVEEPSLEGQSEAGLAEPASSTKATGGSGPQGQTVTTTCQSAVCTPGPAGDAKCTSICGDYAKCFPAWSGWCGGLPCCIMM